MPRKPRFIIPGVPVHIVQRGRSREPMFYDEQTNGFISVD
jgi:REP element-mobilizing transposase RayT